jgi:NosR/NirI family transcriptional regulator, nitrous oxide reductase regulator
MRAGNFGGECAAQPPRRRRIASRVAELCLGLLVALIVAAGVASSPARAGELKKADIAKLYTFPYSTGERDAVLPIWPIIIVGGSGRTDVAGYVFESIDLAPIAGYAGKPVNLLISIDAKGTFTGVKVLSHHEPIFTHGASEETLFRFVEQYKGLSLTDNIKITSASNAGQAQAASAKLIDGVSRASVSVRIVNETALTAALKVARAKLGVGGGPAGGEGAVMQVKPDSGQTFSDEALLAKSYIFKGVIRTADVDTAFGPGFKNDVDPGPNTDPKAAETEVWISYLSVPEIGRAVMGKDGYEKLKVDFRPVDHLLLVATRGRYSLRSSSHRAGAVPDQILIQQDGLVININDAFVRQVPVTSALPKDVNWTLLKVLSESGFDPTRPWNLVLNVARKNSSVYAQRVIKEFPVTYKAPVEFFEAVEPPLSGWRAVWHEQRAQIGFTLAALLVLGLVLLNPKRLPTQHKHFALFRNIYLAVTLCGIGWWAQGQLSILNILGVINTAKEGGSFGYLLFDPVSLILWVFVLGSLVLWGRGTFCGWLCPFGAFQEFASKAGKWMGAPQLRVPYALDRKLRLLKYGVLAALIGAALYSTTLADQLAEFEPFKTSITLGFNRTWPFVAWAAFVLYISTFLYKGFCLYLCPLGAALSVMGRVRALDWIPRRAECGSPCKLCSARCEYGAIEPKGEIKYDECFQCMECVVIIQDPKTCVPEVLATRKRAADTASEYEPAVARKSNGARTTLIQTTARKAEAVEESVI